MSTLYTIVSRVLNIAADQITEATSPENTELWDSFNSLMLVSELEKHYKISFTTGEVADVRSVGDIRALLKKKGITDDAL